MPTKTLTDQLGHNITFSFPPRRIISLVPSQTELLFDLGLNEEIVGITKFCVHPQKRVKAKTKIGGTKQFWFDVIDKLAPDLIIGGKEENYKEGIDQLRMKYPVWMSDVFSFESALQLIHSTGAITDKLEESNFLANEIDTAFKQFNPFKLGRALYLIWQNPWMGVGQGTFIHSMMQSVGFSNVLENQDRYPILTTNKIKALNPSVVLLSTEPYPFRSKHILEVQEILPEAQVCIVDGEMFSWYGSRMKLAPAYFQKLQEQFS